MNNKKNIVKEAINKPTAKSIISTIGSRSNVGNAKKDVNLLSIVQKLSDKRAKASEEESPEKSAE